MKWTSDPAVQVLVARDESHARFGPPDGGQRCRDDVAVALRQPFDAKDNVADV